MFPKVVVAVTAGLSVGSSWFVVGPGRANVVSDGSLPNASNVALQNGQDGQFIIDKGTQPQNGPNLFHSFSEFSLSDGESAYFVSPDGVERIFSRVTGTDISEIFGTLGILNEGNADLFFLNPNGVIFGPNARLDVNGSFIASTSDSIGFVNGGLFSASQPQESVLLTVQPNAFFFNTTSASFAERGSITHQSKKKVANADGSVSRGFEVLEGETIGFLGGAIDIGRIQGIG